MFSQENFSKNFSHHYNQADEKQYGSSGMTLLERKSLREIHQSVRQGLCETIFGDPHPSNLKKYQKEIIRNMTRGEVIDHIVQHGWSQPEPEQVDAPNLAESAVQHACVVAEYLVEARGAQASPDTFFSYTTKSQADRYIAQVLRRAGRINPQGKLYDQWYAPQDRQEGFSNPKVRYPEGVDDTKIYGVGKPHRYWPAQLLRFLEAIRLDKISPEQKAQLKVGKNLKQYAVPWSNLDSTVENASSVDSLAVNIAHKVARELKKNGLTDEQLVEILFTGYNPAGPLKEHGDIPQVHDLWSKLLNKLQADPKLASLSEPLRERVEDSIENLGHQFKYQPSTS